MDIEIGDYVRTKNGEIRKVVEYVVGGYLVDTSYYNEIIKENTLGIIPLEDVKNHNKNITGLLEAGDVAKVNAYGIIFTTILKQSDILSFKVDGWELLEVLTKEQYEQYAYKVEV